MRKALVVDDVQGWCFLHSSVLKEIYGDEIKVDTVLSAKEGYQKLLENNNEPYDIVFTDLQMESDFDPKEAGEWLVEQIQMLKDYYKAKIVIISASPKIRMIAKNYNVDCIPKAVARTTIAAYKEVLNVI